MSRSELLKEFEFEEEEAEVLAGSYQKTGFPQPVKAYRIVWERYDMSLEEPYFWVLDTLKDGFQFIDKIEDSFAAAENSAFFGVTQQRLGAQQDKISQYLATTGKMIKELFQMVRELRILDERITYYRGSAAEMEKPLEERDKADELTLKGMFVDLVQGGGKSPASVYGMARELEFVTLPDLFFDAPPFKNTDELKNHCDNLGKDFNENVIRVLRRHLRQFSEWKTRTHQEHEQRRKFMLQYLLQHFEIIKMYITWIKPYLRNVQRLSMKESGANSPDIVSSFEGSLLDIEILARNRTPVGDSGANGCVLATFNYRTRPELKVVQEGYQRGPVHIGRFEMTLRVYGWTDEQVKKYRDLKDKETIQLFGDVAGSVEKAMELFGPQLDEYLKEAKEVRTSPEKKTEEAPEEEKKPLMERFFGDFYTPRPKKQAKKETPKKEMEAMKDALEAQIEGAKRYAWPTYNNFKKSRKMIAW